jgi:hypothetical protein
MMKEIPDHTDYGAHIELIGDGLRAVAREIKNNHIELRIQFGEKIDTLQSTVNDVEKCLWSIQEELENLNCNAFLIAKAIAGRCTEEDFL